MIEIKISTSAAVLLVTERMRYEFAMRKKIGAVEKDFEMENLDYKTLLNIAEIASFDLILLLPAGILTENNNLDDIISRSMRSLSEVYSKEEFKYYTKEKARRLIKKIADLFENVDAKEFLNN